MIQFKALLIDAYRQLSAAKLFWLTLGLSILIVILFGSIGFNDQGISMFFGAFNIESEGIKAGSPWARGLYMGIFSSFLVKIWLAWIATILALISTCTIFPEFVHSGSIELTISKPIGRLRLFLNKYVVSLLFVFLQVAVFCTGIFICVGLRIGEWNWMIFAAIPVVTIFFSYLFAVCILFGMLTRSGITALLITGVFWMGLWSIQTAEEILTRFLIEQKVTIERFEEGIKKDSEAIKKIIDVDPNDFRIAQRQERVESFRSDINEAKETFNNLDKWHKPISWVLAVSPKAAQTIDLLDRWLSDPRGFDIAAILARDMEAIENDIEEIDPTTDKALRRETRRRTDEEYKTRSLWYVLGTSLLFEGAILGIAGLYFCRKDF